MMTLNTSIRELRGIGPKTVEKLNKLDIATVGDLIYFFPRAWEDFSHKVNISSLKSGMKATVSGEILDIIQRSSFRRRKMKITTLLLSDSSGAIVVTWFNQPYVVKDWEIGDKIIVSGKVSFGKRGLQFTNPLSDKISDNDASFTARGILPIYPQTAGINSRFLRKLIHPLLYSNDIAQLISDFVPDSVLKRNALVSLYNAIQEIHFPTSSEILRNARRRLGFDELFLVQISILLQKRDLEQQKAPKIVSDIEVLKRFIATLPFKPTNDQRKAIWDIIQDMNRGVPMNRLLNGDVGSGKTLVAAAAALMAVRAGYRVAIMAPTEILAKQHYETISRLLGSFGLSVSLIAGKQQDSIKHQISNIKYSKDKKILNTKYVIHNTDIIIGTHALFSDKRRYKKIGLIIVDEQHRFGVEQRRKIKEKAGLKGTMPHFLSMTATPIPRSLGLMLYGDLDISLIREMPVGRKKVLTKYVPDSKRHKAYLFIHDKIKSGGQAFVVCSLIDGAEDEVRKAVLEETKKIQKIFPTLHVECLHGKMSAEKKETVMRDFKDKNIDILVATSVIEVGIDIPNANIIIIEDAERFGLAQLHQFRGRIGRGSEQSYCLLFSTSDNEDALQRLNRFAEISDGFELSEYDLKLRGPGEFWGIEQSGFPRMKVANLWDRELMKLARDEARYVLHKGLDTFSELKEKVEKLYQVKHFE